MDGERASALRSWPLPGLAPLFTYSAGSTCALGRILLPSKGNFTFDNGLHTASLIQGDSNLTASIAFGSSKVVVEFRINSVHLSGNQVVPFRGN